jgi:2-haloalkanoic acid dehalogenase type II
MRLSDFSVLTFDCYGTLIDWESGISGALAPWLERSGVRLERDRVLEAFGELESAQQAATPGMLYPRLLAEVHRGLAERFGIAPDAEAAETFGASVGDWPAFADSTPALAYLEQHYQLVILSNVDRASFARSNAKLGVTFDAVCTAEDIGSYKPDPRNFDHLLRHLAERGVAKGGRSCTRPNRSTTTTSPPSGSGLRPAGFIAAPARRGMARRARPRARRGPISASRAWPPWRRRTAPSAARSRSYQPPSSSRRISTMVW